LDKNIKINPKKIRFKDPEVTYIGHRLSKNGIQSDPDKIKAIKNMPTPKNLKQLKTFLGMVNYLSKFLPNLSTVIEPLRCLDRKDVPWHWEHE